MFGFEMHRPRFTRRAIALTVIASFLFTNGAPAFATGPDDPAKNWGQVKGQLTSDLIQGGITLAAGMTGNVPLALLAGIVGKYISTYGVQGVRSLIDMIKGYPPQDLGEVNIAYLYLINVKRNLYSTLIGIRKAAEGDQRDPNLATELDTLEKDVTALCGNGDCRPVTVDEKLVNYSFLQVALEAKQSLNVNEWLSVNETKNTYQYLLLLYLDLVMTEQQLVQSEAFVIGEQIRDSIEALKKNAYISDAEKEYQAQLVMNIGLRWQKLLDERRVILAQVTAKPLADLEKENEALEAEIRKDQKPKPAPVPPTEEATASDSIWGAN